MADRGWPAGMWKDTPINRKTLESVMISAIREYMTAEVITEANIDISTGEPQFQSVRGSIPSSRRKLSITLEVLGLRPATTGGYKKIGPEHPHYVQYEMWSRRGIFFCDAVDHNSDHGCPNPECPKHKAKP